ncbi:MAG: ABC transporter permease [Candidatus Scatomorpha sp.]|jgi:peptide/nickel transport system permease protein
MKNRAFMIIGLAVLLVFVVTAIFQEQIAPYSPYEQSGKPFERPSGEHIFGTNDIGQDIFSELVYGTRNSLLVGLISATISLALGIIIGVSAGWFGGTTDHILSQITTFFMTIPFLPSVIILSTFTRGGIWSMSIILGFLSWPGIARVLRTTTMQIKESYAIKIIKGMGASDAYIILRHVIPELLPLIAYRAVTRVKAGILSESTMSFLGLGNPIAKSWGSTIYYAQAKNALLNGSWVWWIIPPGVCICLISMALMLIAYEFENMRSSKKEAT